MHRALIVILISIVAISRVTVQADQEKKDPPKPLYEFRQIHDPNGIGKFYMGREIAHVMGFGPKGEGAAWLERKTREEEEAVSKLMPSLEIKAGDVVADLGAGSGHHTVRLAKLVGAAGKVYAVDIQKEMIFMLGNRLKKEKIANVTLIHNTEKDPKLPADAIDMILMVDVYHELSYPYEVMVELVKSLKPGGRLVFVEFRLEDKKVPILDVHRMSIAQVKKEMAPHAEMKYQKTLDHLPWQHVIVFERVARKKEPEEPAKSDLPAGDSS